MQNKIIFHDNANDGHRFIYNYTVMSNLTKQNISKIYYCSPLEDELQKRELESALINVINVEKGISQNRYTDMFFRLKDLFRLSRICDKNSINKIHFFNLDSVIVYIFLLFLIFRNKDITGTLHWYPSRKSKRILLHLLLKMKILKGIIVHGHYTYNRFSGVSGINREKQISVINYPDLHIKTGEMQNKLFDEFTKPILLAFGGLRFDKGIDILLRALGEIRNKEFKLIVAGKEEDFSRSDLEEKIEEYRLKEKVILHIGYVKDEDIESYFANSDVVVLPYRKVFTGQSGPLTEGVMHNKIILGPNHGEVGFTISHYGLGNVFEAENIKSLVNELSYVINNYQSVKLEIYKNQENYKNQISKQKFIERYQAYFRSE